MLRNEWHKLDDFRYVKNRLLETRGHVREEVMKKVHNAYRHEKRVKIAGVVPPPDNRPPWEILADRRREEWCQAMVNENKARRQAAEEA